MAWYDPRTWFKKKEVIVVKEIPPEKKEAVVSVHIAKKTPTGEVKQVGTYVRRGGGGAPGAARVTEVKGVTIEQAKEIEKIEAQKIEAQKVEPPPEKTIARQLAEKPKPSMVSAQEPVVSMRQTWGEATMQFLKRRPEGYKRAFKGAVKDLDMGEGFRYMFKPFKHAGELKGEKIIVTIPARGTIQTDPLTGEKIYEIKKTKFDIAEEQRLKTGEYVKFLALPPEAGYFALSEKLAKKYKPETEEELKKAQEEYEKEFEEESKKLQKFYSEQPKGLYERTGTRVSKYAPIAAEAGTTIGISLISPAGAAVVSGFIFGGSMGRFIKAETIPGKALAVAGMGAGLYGMGATMKSLQKSITMGEVKEAIAAKPQLKLGIREKLKGGVVKDIYVSKYKFAGTKVMKDVEVYSKLIKGKTSIIKGRAGVYAKTYEYMTGKEIYYGAITKFKGKGAPLEVGTAGWQPSISVGDVSKQMELFKRAGKTRFDFYSPAKFQEKIIVGGIAKGTDKGIVSAGGKIIKLRKPWVTRQGIVIQKAGFDVDVAEFSLLKIKQPSHSDLGFIKTTGIKSSREYLKQLYAPPVTGVAEKLIQAPSIIQTPLTPLVPTTGILARTITKVKAEIKPVLKTKIKLIPKQKEAVAQIPKLIIKVKEKEKLISPFKTRQEAISIPKQKEAVAQIPILKQPQIPKQKLKQSLIPAFQSSPPPRMPSFSFPKDTPWGFPFLPKARLLKETKRIIKVRKLTSPSRYKPSFIALGMGIKAPRIPKAYLRGAGAMIVRPIISPRRKKKKGSLFI